MVTNKIIQEIKEKIDSDKRFKLKMVKELFSDGKTVWLNELDFTKDGLDLNFSGNKTTGNVFNNNQQAKNIDNSMQVVNYKILNIKQMAVSGNIINERQCASYIENKNQKSQTNKTTNVVKKILG